MLARDMLKLIWWVVIGLFRAAEKRRSESGLVTRSFLFRPLRRNGRQEGRVSLLWGLALSTCRPSRCRQRLVLVA